MSFFNITIDCDKRCPECRQKGVCGNGLCLACTTRAMRGLKMKTEIGEKVKQTIAIRFAGRDKNKSVFGKLQDLTQPTDKDGGM